MVFNVLIKIIKNEYNRDKAVKLKGLRALVGPSVSAIIHA